MRTESMEIPFADYICAEMERNPTSGTVEFDLVMHLDANVTADVKKGNQWNCSKANIVVIMSDSYSRIVFDRSLSACFLNRYPFIWTIRQLADDPARRQASNHVIFNECPSKEFFKWFDLT